MLKKIIRLALTPLLVLGLTFSGFGMAFAAPEGELSDLQIRETLDEINDRYEVGEAFSEEDANFVKKYVVLPSESVQPMSSFHKTYSGALGSTEGFGFIKGDVGVFGGYFEGYINVQTVDFTERTLGVEAKVTAYGVVGNGGFGKVYDRTFSHQKKEKNLGINFQDSIAGAGVSATAYSFRGIVDGNSFNMYEQ